MTDYLAELPPELISFLPPSLSTSSLNALVLTCRRLREILQPALESRITPALARDLLVWAAASKPHIVTKLLSPPHSVHPGSAYWKTPLHVAAEAKNTEIAALLLHAGADPSAQWEQDWYQALHLAAMKEDFEMMKLLLDHGAPIDDRWGCDGCSENALHFACSKGNFEMVELLLSRGADLESHGHYGTALGFAVRRNLNIGLVKFLLNKGAKAEVTVPLFILLVGGPPYPHEANLLYIALRLRHPIGSESSRWHRGHRQRQPTILPKWEGLPLDENQKRLMALLLAHGASKATTMGTVTTYLGPLAEAAKHTEDEFLDMINAMIKEAEDAIPDVLGELSANSK